MPGMACNVVRLLTATDCGVCGRTVAEGYAVITDEVEQPVWLVVCEGCEDGLTGLDRAQRVLEFKGAARSGRRTPGNP